MTVANDSCDLKKYSLSRLEAWCLPNPPAPALPSLPPLLTLSVSEAAAAAAAPASGQLPERPLWCFLELWEVGWCQAVDSSPHSSESYSESEGPPSLSLISTARRRARMDATSVPLKPGPLPAAPSASAFCFCSTFFRAMPSLMALSRSDLMSF